ncbi:hypothetical protein GXW74_19015 [Roseomonas eburnea]|uniref:CBU-0592-like domain-containing protein n=1 Tax=Neoroseomonas eburnea TaxID=1346889 RepID=A0A9X9XFV5_9PROT|nr:hypothetical protein [Neoroseomonas eburnea]MBR0682591.1 hypothetical protein [Neoroseomonas eburnea]
MAEVLGRVTLFDPVGIAGTLTVVLAYLGTQLRRVDAKGLGFPLANLIGSALITVSLWRSFNLASMLIETFWMAISLFGIGRWLGERRAAGAAEAGRPGSPGAPC